MEQQLSPTRDPGLLSVLEGGLAVIQQEETDEDRRHQILEALSQMFSDASRGTQALTSQNLLAVAEDQSSFEHLSLFVNYLDDPFGVDLSPRLTEAASVVGALREGKQQDAQLKARVCEILERLLEALKADYLTTPLAPPVDFQY